MLMLIRGSSTGWRSKSRVMEPAVEPGAACGEIVRHLQPSSKRPVNPLGRLLTDHRPMEHETSLYLLVSFLDFLLTWWMLEHRSEDGPRFGESNAVAQYFLSGWGLRGMLYFKVAICLFVVLATQTIHVRRPKTARYVLWLGIVVTSLTVAYSSALYVRHTGGARQSPPEVLEGLGE
jgi:hypothetical protein